MKILLLAPNYLNLYLPILQQLSERGDTCFVICDENLICDPYFENKSFLGMIKNHYHRFQWKRNRKYESYWQYKIESTPELSRQYDILFVINGCLFHPYLLNHLKTINPLIRSYLYVWDSSRYYQYFRFYKSFDKVYTFDLKDSKKFKVEFLPFYWVQMSTPIIDEKKYFMSIVGSNHDGRLALVSTIANQLKHIGKCNNYFCLFSERRDLRPEELASYEKWSRDGTHPQELHDFNIILGKEMSEFITYQSIPIEDTIRIMAESEVVLDTDRETQSGTTPRVIWALALGKKIVSTNKNLKMMPFYDSNRISIIDRFNPVLDRDFLLKPINDLVIPDYVQQLRIDRWVNFIK